MAAILAAATLVGGVVGLTTRSRRTRPWLMVLYGVNAEHGDVSHEALRTVVPVDILLLVLAGLTYAGFWPGPGADHTWWMVLAIAQPLLGVAILLVTRLLGRSGLMGGALVLSVLMVRDSTGAVAGWLGVAASTLLLVGDFGTTGRPRPALALVLAVGYAALIGWFCWDAGLLLA